VVLSEGDNVPEAVKTAASATRLDIPWGLVSDKSLWKLANGGQPGIVVVDKFTDSTETPAFLPLSQVTDADAAEKFARVETVPLLSKWKDSLHAGFARLGLPVVELYLDFSSHKVAKRSRQLGEDIKPLARKLRGEIAFVYKHHDYAMALEEVGLNPGKLPAVAITRLSINVTSEPEAYTIKQQGFDAVTPKSIEDFIERFRRGEEEISRQSAMPLEKDDNPVKTVVWNDFERLTSSPGGALLVLVQPWDAETRSKELLENLVYLATGAKELAPTLLIAALDTSTNYVPPSLPHDKDAPDPSVFFFTQGNEPEKLVASDKWSLNELAKILSSRTGVPADKFLSWADIAKKQNPAPKVPFNDQFLPPPEVEGGDGFQSGQFPGMGNFPGMGGEEDAEQEERAALDAEDYMAPADKKRSAKRRAKKAKEEKKIEDALDDIFTDEL